MAKKKKLVIQHLEKVSWRVLEDYKDVIREFIRGKSGVYALYKRDKLYYVGLASNLITRIKRHLRDRHKEAWDRFSVYLTVHDGHIKELESLLLRIVNPDGNLTSGKFSDSENLARKLNRLIKEKDEDNRAVLMGGKAARRRQKSRASKKKGTQPLSRFIENRMYLRAWHKGKEYKATLRKDGKISFQGKFYEAPTSASKAVIEGNRNGWKFWHYRNDSGDWVTLNNLKK